MGIRAALGLTAAAAPSAVRASAPAVRGGWGIASAASWGAIPEGLTLTRDTAMSVPAFRQGVSIISGTVGTFPLQTRRGGERVELPTFLAQPDPDEPPSVTWTRLVADLVLFPYAWLYVTVKRADGFPGQAIQLPAEHVSIDVDGAVRWTGSPVRGLPADGILSPGRVIRFDSPHAPGALADGAQLLGTALLIEQAARRFASMDVPSGYLQQTGGPDLDGDEIGELLDSWDAARQSRMTAFLSQTLNYSTTAFDPRQLQLVEARQHVAVEVARLLNMPPVYVNAETGGSLTYSTVAQQSQSLLNTTLLPYLSAVSGRLSMGDVTPQGTTVDYQLDAFLRTDLPARIGAYSQAIAAGVMTVNEARAAEDLPALPDAGMAQPEQSEGVSDAASVTE